MESTRVEICFAIKGARSEVFESLTNLKITINYCIHAKMSLINDDIQWFPELQICGAERADQLSSGFSNGLSAQLS